MLFLFILSLGYLASSGYPFNSPFLTRHGTARKSLLLSKKNSIDREEVGSFFNNSPYLSKLQCPPWICKHYHFTNIVLRNNMAAESPWTPRLLRTRPFPILCWPQGQSDVQPSSSSELLSWSALWHMFTPPWYVFSWKNFQHNLPAYKKGGKNKKQPGSQKLHTLVPNTLNDRLHDLE